MSNADVETRGPRCYVCKTPIDDELVSFPFCSGAHHEEWARTHYNTPKQIEKHGRTLAQAIERARELGGKKHDTHYIPAGD